MDESEGLAADSGSWTEFGHCQLGGCRMVTASRAELAEGMAADCLAARRRTPQTRARLVFDVNGHGLSLREMDAAYRAAMDRADIIHADGGFLVTLSRWLTKSPIAERSATTDLFHDCAGEAAAKGLSFYLLGGTEAVNAACARRVAALYPGLRIVGRRNGYFQESEEESIVEAINRTEPDVLWVGLGKPKEQLFSVKWRDRLKAGWIATCGGCFNFVTGEYGRAPQWMQRANLEWLHRMLSNPRKLFWRYLTTNPHALWLILRYRASHGGKGTAHDA